MFDGPDICSLEGELAVSVYSSRTALLSSRVPLTENQMHESPFGEDLLRFRIKPRWTEIANELRFRFL